MESSPSLDATLRRYSRIHGIVSPPRCSSTAFSRVFWEHPAVRFYSHEPFEVTYYMEGGLDDVVDKLASPLDLERLESYRGGSVDRGLLIKEMPYQVSGNFPLLASIVEPPLIFLMRDPRLNIASRMKKKREVGDDPVFPRVETGWELWAEQIEWCRSRGIDHMLVDSTDFRNRPLEIFPQVFERLGLSFEPGMLEWTACPEVELDNLDGRHRHLYGKVLESTGIRPASEPVPPLDAFPEKAGWRDHVARCLAIYEEFGARDERVRPSASPDSRNDPGTVRGGLDGDGQGRQRGERAVEVEVAVTGAGETRAEGWGYPLLRTV